MLNLYEKILIWLMLTDRKLCNDLEDETLACFLSSLTAVLAATILFYKSKTRQIFSTILPKQTPSVYRNEVILK